MISKQFIRTLVFTCFLIITYSSCKKADKSEPQAINVTIGSPAYKFGSEMVASRFNSPGSIGFKLHAKLSEGSKSYFDILITTSAPTGLTSGSYTENVAMNPRIEITYHSFFSFLGYEAHTDYSNYQSTSNPISITITEFNNGSVRGTFSGEVKDRTSTQLLTFTNGQFYARF